MAEEETSRHPASSDYYFSFYPMRQPTMRFQSTSALTRGVFAPEECQKIIDLALQQGLAPARIGRSEIVEEVRKSQVCFLRSTEATKWIFQKLHAVAFAANHQSFGFHLSGYFEAVQITRYTHEADHYDWHTDMGDNEMSQRKLSQVVFLSDPKDYDGGQLELFASRHRGPVSNEQGNCVLFPAFEQHRVLPVTRGVRWSLVAWISGPPFI